jgi:serine/alanine adding enzyme
MAQFMVPTLAELEVNSLQAADEAEYRAFVESSPAGNYCQDLGWKAVIEATYGKKPDYLICREKETGRIAGVAPAFWMDSLVFGRRLVSLPYLDYGGILADNAEAEDALAEALLEDAHARKAKLEIRQSSPLPNRQAPANRKVRMVLDLRDLTEEGYWKSLDAKVRNQVRKAGKSEITVRTGRAELLEEFYRVFCVNMRDLGSPVHDLALFRNVLDQFPGAEIALAMWKGLCVGGLVRIHWKHTLAIPWASTLRQYRGYCPNNAIYWDSIATALRRGCETVDFGRSTRDEGTYRFKRQWLAEEGPLPWYSFDPSGRAPADIGQPGGLMQAISGLWTKLPTWYANRLGPSIRGAMSN